MRSKSNTHLESKIQDTQNDAVMGRMPFQGMNTRMGCKSRLGMSIQRVSGERVSPGNERPGSEGLGMNVQ